MIPSTMAKPNRPKNVPSPRALRALREKLGLTIAQAAKRIGVGARAWASWEQPSQDRWPAPSHLILIRLLSEGKLNE
jgi:transcriptional regulator with XRE-family HTH domain